MRGTHYLHMEQKEQMTAALQGSALTESMVRVELGARVSVFMSKEQGQQLLEQLERALQE